MKKLFVLFVAVFGLFALTSCGKAKTDEEHDYYVTGQFAGWGDAAGNENFLMEAIKSNDERIKDLKKEDLKDAVYIYIFEATFPAGAAGWDVTYKIDGEEITVDGNLTVKILQITKGEESPNWWGQAPESGEFKNLTPDTLYLPPFVGEKIDGAGDWNDNPILFEAGTYYVVYVQYAKASHGLALIKK